MSATSAPAAQHTAAARGADPARPYAAALLLLCGAGLLAWRVLAPAPWQGSLIAYFLAYTLEAAPFIALGALLSGLMETLLPAALLPRLTARLGWLSVPAAVALSPLFPTCECGVVAIGRGLLRKGLPLGAALAYLLAAPVLNPTVLWSTWIAFQDPRYVIYRAAGAVLIACTVGWLLGRIGPGRALQEDYALRSAGGEHSHEPAPGAPSPSLGARLLHAMVHARQDFGEMMLYFLCGVALASALKTFLAATLLTQWGAGAVSGPAALMGTSFILSLCSEADAFPAAGFTEFGLPAKLAFLVLGPMLDIKLLLMYRTLFRGWFLAAYAGSIICGVALFAAALTWLGGPR